MSYRRIWQHDIEARTLIIATTAQPYKPEDHTIIWNMESEMFYLKTLSVAKIIQCRL